MYFVPVCLVNKLGNCCLQFRMLLTPGIRWRAIVRSRRARHKGLSDPCCGKWSKSLKLDLFRKHMTRDLYIFGRTGLQGNPSKPCHGFLWDYERPGIPLQYKSKHTGLQAENPRIDLNGLVENQQQFLRKFNTLHNIFFFGCGFCGNLGGKHSYQFIKSQLDQVLRA